MSNARLLVFFITEWQDVQLVRVVGAGLPAEAGAALVVLLAAFDRVKQDGYFPFRSENAKGSPAKDLKEFFRVYPGTRLPEHAQYSSNVAFFVPPKYLALRSPDLICSARRVEDRWVVEVKAARFAAFVHVGLREGYALFSDNDFHMLPGETRRIEVLSTELPADQFTTRLFARSLIDSRGATSASSPTGETLHRRARSLIDSRRETATAGAGPAGP